MNKATRYLELIIRENKTLAFKKYKLLDVADEIDELTSFMILKMGNIS
ncbi:hypothetical protein [Liquorilactobacillus uvarum]|nr:hypothetical protein [Liquorilactobacillus uvarum]